MLVLTQERHIKRQIKNVASKRINLFYGTPEENRRVENEDKLLVPEVEAIIKMKTPNYKNSESYVEHWRDINNLRKKFDPQNIANTPGDLATLIQLYIMDITRQTMEQIDYTNLLTIENTDYSYPESISLRNLFKYRGKFKPISGANDSVGLIQQNTGEIRSINMAIYGLGWRETLHNLLFNSLHSIQKVMDAVSESYILERNDLTLGQIFAKSLSTPSGWHTSQRQAAEVTATETYWQNLYDTIYFAIKKLRGLRDPQNHKYIPAPRIVFLCHSTRRDECAAVINGKLETTQATVGRAKLYSALPISELWTYDGDSYTYGQDTVTFEGCPEDKFYVFVPRSVWYTAVKRPITMEVGRGSALNFSQEERAWYFAQTSYSNDFFGSSAPGATSTGEGFIIEGTLPTHEEDT